MSAGQFGVSAIKNVVYGCRLGMTFTRLGVSSCRILTTFSRLGTADGQRALSDARLGLSGCRLCQICLSNLVNHLLTTIGFSLISQA